MILKVYDDDFNPINVITHISSLQWYDKWQDVGTFELHTTDDVLDVDSIICFKHNGIVFGGFVNRIEKYDNEIVATGYDFKGLLNRRYIYEEQSFASGSGVRTALINTSQTGLLQRPMLPKVGGSDPYATIQSYRAWSSSRGSIHHVWNPSSDIVDNFNDVTKINTGYYMEAFKSLMDEYGFGITAYPDIDNAKVNVFACKGDDLTSTTVLAYRNGNVEKITFTDDVSGTYNSIIYKDGNAFTVYKDGSVKGLGLREGYTTIPDNVVPSKEAQKYYKENQAEDEITVTANERVDLKLGSLVSLIFRGTMYTKQITQLQYVFEYGNVYTIATIGKPNKNILRRLGNVL